MKITTPHWLPPKEFYEFAYHKFLTNSNLDFMGWQACDTWSYPDRDILRFSHLIGNQLELIESKKVLDVGCHLGYVSLFCLHNQSRYVTGTEPRYQKIEIAKEICSAAGYDNFNFLSTNINDDIGMKKLYDTHDTVILSGILYHITDHFRVLKIIADSSVSSIIIESEDTCPELGTMPMISWKLESSAVQENAFHDNQADVPVGAPNRYWFHFILKFLGFHIQYSKTFEFVTPTGRLTKRFVISATKI